MTKSLSFDSAIPPTPVLDNKVALDKKAVMNNQRAKPSRGVSRGPDDSPAPTSSNVTFTVEEPSVPEVCCFFVYTSFLPYVVFTPIPEKLSYRFNFVNIWVFYPAKV